MAEAPHMPTREEILERATAMFMMEQERVGLPPITPEEDELKEGSYWDRARNDLMTGVRSMLEDHLSYLEGEAAKIREELGIEEVIPEEKIIELEDKLSTLAERFKTSKSRLKEAQAEIERLKPKLPPPPPVVKMPLRDFPEQIKDLRERLTREAHSQFLARELGETGWLAHRGTVSSIIYTSLLMHGDEPKQEAERKIIERVDREVEKLILEIKPPVAPPPVAPPPAVERVGIPAVTQLGPRRRRLETRTCEILECLEPFTIDRDLMYRVRLVPVLKASTARLGARFEPLLMFPNRFYRLCPRHRKEKFGYTGIYDALAYLLAESRSGQRLAVTKESLREVGLDDKDLEEIQREKTKYLGVVGVR